MPLLSLRWLGIAAAFAWGVHRTLVQFNTHRDFGLLAVVLLVALGVSGHPALGSEVWVRKFPNASAL